MKKTKEIIIMLNENSIIYNQFNNSQLSDELHEYIYNQFKGEPLKTNIKIGIHHSFDMNDQEKDKLVNEIREDFGIDIKENLIKLKIERIKQIIFLIIGTLLIITSNLLTADNLALIREIISIFGWVWLWEFVYSFAFNGVKTRIQNKRFLKLIKSKIYFKKTV